MSRTVSNTVEYFPHFAKQGKTLYILKSRYGNNGYAFWFQLLEVLSQSENHFYDCRAPDLWQYLLSICGSNEITGTEILNLLATLGNIDAELWQKKVIWCQKLVENLADVYKKRGRQLPSKPLIDNNYPFPDTNKSITGTEMPQSKVKNSKVKNSKVVEPAALKEIFYSFQNDSGYKDIDFGNEFKKFCEYWFEGTRKLKNKKLACHNWLDSAVRYEKQNRPNGPPKKDAMEPPSKIPGLTIEDFGK